MGRGQFDAGVNGLKNILCKLYKHAFLQLRGVFVGHPFVLLSHPDVNSHVAKRFYFKTV